MTQYKITAPVALFSGTVADVVFSQGQALLTVDPDAERADGATSLPKENVALAYFLRKGYTVEEVEKPEDAKLDTETANPGTSASRAVDPAGIAGSGVQAPAPAPAPVGSTELAAQSTAGDDDENDGGDGKPRLPAKTASKADWFEYATTHGGMTAEEADATSRDKLAAKYHEEASK
jgi:hypothetical protein